MVLTEKLVLNIFPPASVLVFILVLSHFSAIKAELTLTLQVAGWVFCTFFLLAVHPGPAEMPQPKLLFSKLPCGFTSSLGSSFQAGYTKTQEAASRSFSITSALTLVCSQPPAL